MAILFYKLVGRKVVPVGDWDDTSFAIEDRQVAKTTIGDFDISTVFLVIDHGFRGPPVLFETMVFQQGESDVGNWTRRYCTYDEAVDGHNEIVEEVRKAIGDSANVVNTLMETFGNE